MRTAFPTRRILYILAVTAVLLISAALYWPAMHGPYVLDDIDNLEPLKRWLEGMLGWRGVVLDNRSGVLGRPVSMATFLFDVWRTRQMDSFTFKPSNLAIHLLCGASVIVLARQIFRRWAATRSHASALALIFGTWWLWLPLSVSTVLYVVQRMAQLSALFMLLALICYMAARAQIERGWRRGHLLLWLGVPALTLFAVLSKENGALALPLALVLEVFLFTDGGKRSTSIKVFFALTVILPALGGAFYCLLNPAAITAGYATRPFSLTERLLTEPRILWNYVQTLLLPFGRHMGIFHDNYPVSTGLLQPVSTLLAILAWCGTAILGWLRRRRNPLFAAGVFFFLIGHALESGPIALELYFEHRNYLPSFGILLAVTGLLVEAWQALPTPTALFRRACAVLMSCILAIYAFGTWVHAQSWRTDQTFYATQAAYNPTSPRLQSDLTARALAAGDLQSALLHIEIGERNSPDSERTTATLWRFLAYCAAGQPAPVALYQEFSGRAHGRITTFAMRALELLAADVESGCRGFDPHTFATIAEPWIDHAPMAASDQNVWRSRYNLARIVASSGDIAGARSLAAEAWKDSDYNNGIGVFLFQLDATLGDVAACREVLARLERAAGGADRRLDAAVTSFRSALDRGQIGPGK